jgi:NADH-quinone oxidoreductase subunit L
LVLAALSALAGLIGVSARLVGGGGESLIEEWLAPVLRDSNAPFAHGGVAVEWGVIAAAYAVAIGGWALARARYGENRAKDWEAQEHRVPLFAASTHGWWLDAILTRAFHALAVHASAFLAEFDRRVIDGFVNAGGMGTRAFAWIVGRADDGLVDGAVRGLSAGTLRVGARLQRVQSGRVQTYVLVIVFGVMALAFIPYWLR